MKKLLPVIILFLAFTGFSQTVNKKYVDGIIYFQLKKDAAYKIPCDQNGRTNLKDFAFLGDIASKYQITEIRKSFYMAKDEKLLRTYKVFFKKINQADALVKELERKGIIEYAEKLPVYKLSYVPNDPIYSQTSGSGGATMHFNWPLTKINAPAAWNITKGSAAIKVAIVDNAIYTAHPDLTNKIVAQYDAADLDNVASPPGSGTSTLANYEWSHGTHVAGLVGAQSDNGIGVASIGFSVSLVAVKIAEDATGNLTAGYEGVTWASTTGAAKVINMSWGGYGSSTTAANVITAAYNQGCVLVAAAGNNGDGGEDMANINGILYPAAYTECIAVAATNSDDTKASFSEYGTWVDVSAPGGNEAISGWSSPYVTPLISTTWCNTYGMGTYYGLSNSLFGTNAKYDGMQGTSMASPLVAGLAGLIWSVNPSMTKVQVRNCIINTADNISAANSATAALAGKLGSGRINALAAVQCAQASGSVAPTASFIGAPLNICPGSTVSFTNTTTTSTTTTYSWAFQGGTPATSTQTNVTVTYNTPGVYSVTLTATNAYGSNSSIQTAYVNVVAGAAIPLVEGFQSATFPPTNWYLVDDGADNVKWALKTTAGQASTQSTFFDNYNDAANAGYRDQLKTYVNLTGYNTAKMTFYRAYSATFGTPNMDSLQIGVSTNCGASITSAYLKGGTTFSTAVNPNGNTTAFTPTSAAQWKKDSIDLTPYVGQASVMIAFINRGHYGDNLYLDNINITGTSLASPTAAITSPSTGCTGSAITLTDASTGGPTSWIWSMPGGTPASANVQNISVTYATAGVKTISLTVANASGTTTATKTITITATPAVAASVTNTTICSGNSVTETLTGASTYTWLPGGSGSSSVLSPASTTIYTVTGSTGACVSAATNFTVNVTTTPTVGVSASSASICTGQTTTLTASGATNYSWLPGSQTTTVITVNPSSSTVYTVTGSNGSCSSTKTISINVSSAPTLTASVTNTTVCSGTPVTVNMSGATSYTWLPTGSGSSSVLTPAATTIYSITGSNGGCASAVKTVTITVTTTPTVGLSASSASVCSGQTTTLTASGATNYSWLPGSQTTTVITVNPSSTTVYTVTGSNGSCSSTQTISINVSTAPTVTTSLTNTTVCSGTPVTVNVGGATSYAWLPTGSGSSSILTPAATTIYTITGANGGCVGAVKTVTINVTTTPTVGISVSSASICSGQTATLTASGATNYAWLPGSQTTTVITVSPSSTTVYTVTGSNGSCSSTQTTAITIVSTPSITPSITNTTVCSGTPVTVNVTGGATAYTWLPTGSGSSSVLTPASTTIYTVTGSVGSCNSTSKTFTINVNPSPTTGITASSSTLCSGQTVTLTASGATAYNWLPGSQTSAVIIVTPSSTTTYSLTGTIGGCSSSANITINVSSTPTISASVTNTSVCSGVSVPVSMTGGTTYNWVPAGAGATCALAPLSTTVYTVTSTGACGSNAVTFTITILPPPVISVSATSTLICAGSSSTLTATGGITYTWTPLTGITGSGNVVVANPPSSTAYTVTGHNGICPGNQVVVINVNPCTGIENYTSGNELMVYPNPSIGVFTISNIGNTGKLDVSVTNALGQLVMAESSKNPEMLILDMSAFGRGIYYMKVQTANGNKLVKVVLE